MLFRSIDISLFNEGKHYSIYEKMGAHPMTVDGVELSLIHISLGATGFRATNLQEFEDAMKQAIELNKPVVIDCIIGKDDKVWPMVCLLYTSA